MCYHVSQLELFPAMVKKRYGVTRYKEKATKNKKGYHLNGFSHPKILVVANDDPGAVQQMKWGLIPFWVKDGDQAKQMANRTLNAKSETVFDLASFRAAITKRRCIIPVNGFYEWRHYKGRTYPHYIYPKDGSLFSLGGIWEEWTDKTTGELVRTFSIVTTPANSVMEVIHNTKKRMPLVLDPVRELDWISEGLTKGDITSLMFPYDPSGMNYHTIDRLITSRTTDSNVEEVKIPVIYPELSPSIF